MKKKWRKGKRGEGGLGNWEEKMNVYNIIIITTHTHTQRDDTHSV